MQGETLFQLEDGSSLTIAVHSDVPHHDRICEIIHANGGFVVEDASSADFCVISLATPHAGALAEELGLQEKVTVQDYWIRDSVYAKRLLPWYPYQIGPSLSSSTGAERVLSTMSPTELEERDTHEFVVTSARYWPLFSMEELYRYVSRKCPHRTATAFKEIYAAHQPEIDSRVMYLRRRLENVLAFKSDFTSRPRMSFGAPSKSYPLQIQLPTSAVITPFMPTPTATSGSHADLPERLGSRGRLSVIAPQQEVPYEPPNIGDEYMEGHGPANSSDRQVALRQRSTAGETMDVVMSDSARARRSGQQSGGETNGTTTPTSPEKGAQKAGAHNPQLVSKEDKYELAKFLVAHPKGQLGFKKHMVTFRKLSSRGRLRTVGSWQYIYREYGNEIRKMMNKVEKGSGKNQETKGTSKVVVRSPPNVSRPPAKRRPTLFGKRHTRGGPDNPSRNLMTDQDKEELAYYLLDHPRDPDMSLPTYYARFDRQYKNGIHRTASAWASAVGRHKEDIHARQRRILRERGDKNHPLLTGKDTGKNARKHNSADDPDSDLSSIETSSSA
ncbi:hypothetical protein M408DRAFT_329719, partial [Serendipita vermifera MAFF 305830]